MKLGLYLNGHTYIHAYTYIYIHLSPIYYASKIYSNFYIFLLRYLSRKTEEQVVLPEAIRKKIMQGLFNAPQVILTFSYMHTLYYIYYTIFVSK